MGLVVQLHMTRKKIKQAALCAALGLEQSGVSRKLNGKRAITLRELPAFAAVLGTTPAALLEEAWALTVGELGEPEGTDPTDSTRKLKAVA